MVKSTSYSKADVNSINKSNCIPREMVPEARYKLQDFIPEPFGWETVPDFGYNILNRYSPMYRPIYDEALLTKGRKRPVWPSGKPFAVCLTHDVDRVSLFSPRDHIRLSRIAWKANRPFSDRLKDVFGHTFQIVNGIFRLDLIACLERWLQVEREVHARSTFFFSSGLGSIKRRDSRDCVYELFDYVLFNNQKCSVAEMIRDIHHQGWEVGLHPSWHSYNDYDEMRRQKAALESELNHDVVSVRQHCLRFDVRITPRILTQSGFLYDSTLGFNDNVGFRLGTCYPHYVVDIGTDEQLPLTEVPLIIQDGALLSRTKGLRLDPRTAFDYVKQLTCAVEEVGGVLTVLWHPDYIYDQDWWGLYCEMLQYFRAKNAYMSSLGDIGLLWNTSQMPI